MTFNKFHESGHLNELCLNISHRYFNMSGERYLEYLHIFQHLKRNANSWEKEKCLFVIPSTQTWVFMDCHKVFENVTFLCEYPADSPEILTSDEIPVEYCNKGWIFYGKYCYILQSLSIYSNRNISVIQIENLCDKIGSKIASVKSLNMDLSDILKRLFEMENHQTFAFLKFQSEVIRIPMSEFSFSRNVKIETIYLEVQFPYQLPNKKQAYVICSQDPIKIPENCMNGFLPCENGECIPETYFCDSHPQCDDQSDEINCTDSCSTAYLHFQCGQGKCIALSKVCDLISDCEEGEDEEECPDFEEGYLPNWSPLTLKKQQEECIKTESNILHLTKQGILASKRELFDDKGMICPIDSQICFPKKYHCVRDKDYYGNELPCFNSKQLDKCETRYSRETPRYYQCGTDLTNEVRVPFRLRCNGIPECPVGDDEWNCNNFTCPKLLRCTKERMCVHPSEVCDGVLHCPISGDDEYFCSSNECPSGCKCLGRAIYCTSLPASQLNDFAIVVFRLKFLKEEFLINMPDAWFANLSYCNIGSIIILRKIVIPQVVKLDISHNSILDFSSKTVNLNKVKFLYFKGSNMKAIMLDTFQNMKNLVRLYLANSKISWIQKCSFCNQKKLELLDLTSTKITQITQESLSGLNGIKIIRLIDSPIRLAYKNILLRSSLKELATNDINFCCLHGNDVVLVCKNVQVSMLWKVCQNYYPKASGIVLAVIFSVGLLNSITLLHLLFFSWKLETTFLLISILNGLLISLVLIAFHFCNKSINSSSSAIFDHAESKRCLTVAYGYFALSFLFHCSNVLFFLNILLKVGQLSNVHVKGNKQEILLMKILMIMIGVLLLVVMSSGNHQSPFCILKFTQEKQIPIDCAKGLLSLSAIGIIFLIQRKIETSRKNSKRKELKSEKILKVRMYIYAINTAMSILFHFIHNYHPSPTKAAYFFILYAEFSLLPMSFPILFGLSTTQFRAQALSWIKKLGFAN